MVSASLEFDLSQITELQTAINKFGGANSSVFPETSKAFGESAKYAKSVLSNYLAGGKLDGIRELTDKEISSIRGVKIAAEQTGDFESKVTANNPRLDNLQNGLPNVDYDMKKTHPYGRKSRVSKEGIPYLIIPFRWGTPNGKGTKRRWNNVIPQKQYETKLKEFEISSFAKKNGRWTHPEPNFKGEDIERKNYKWKSRLKEDDAWDDRSVGMVRMRDNAGGKSTYFTFRIISAKSPENSWMYHRDGTDAVDILSALGRTTKPGIERIIEAGLKADLGMS